MIVELCSGPEIDLTGDGVKKGDALHVKDISTKGSIAVIL